MLVRSSWLSSQLTTGTETTPSVTFAPHAFVLPPLAFDVCALEVNATLPTPRPIQNAAAERPTHASVT